MENFEHTPSARGQVFLWGGIVAGLVLLLLLYTRGFGLFVRHAGEAETPLLEHRGAQIFIPENSPLRQRLTVVPAAEESVSGNVLAPGLVESDPARTALLLSPVAGRVKEVKVSPGSRVSAGEVLAVIDSPDLAQAYDDDVKAADTLRLTTKNLERQESQYQIGAVAERDLDQTRSDHAQAASEYARTQAHLRAIGVAPDSKQRSSLFTVRAPFDGSVTAVAIATGNMLNDPTQSILTLADLSTVWVTALVAEKDLPGVAQGLSHRDAQGQGAVGERCGGSGLAPQQGAYCLPQCALRPEAEHVHHREALWATARAGGPAHFRLAHEQRPHQRLRGRRTLDV
jgi:multidrug efflux pump subunit AcrA (membrane-fusion protein)